VPQANSIAWPGQAKTLAFLRSMEAMQESMGAEGFNAFISDFGQCAPSQ
jgi:hypothetical protein